MLERKVYALCVFLLFSGFAFSQNNEANVKPVPDEKTVNENTSKPVSSPVDSIPSIPVTKEEDKIVPVAKTVPVAINPESSTPKPINEEKSSPAAEITRKTSTSKPAVTSTLPPPGPTTPKPITTTAIPVYPPGPAEKGSWNVTENNQTCILIVGKIGLEVRVKNETTNVTQDVKVWVPKNAVASGSCYHNNITLSWGNDTLTLHFKKNETKKNYALTSVTGKVKVGKPIIINPNEKFNLFETPLNQSYSCSSVQSQQIEDDVKILFEEIHLQAFKTTKNDGFDESLDCATQQTPDIVPIIVGCVLGLLVISVLVAYLISRRRSQTRGYLSM